MPKKIEKISTMWTKEAPFFSEFTYRFFYYEMSRGEMQIPTMGVQVKNAKLNLFYDKEFLEKVSLPELEFVLIHEIMHIISLHQERFNKIENSQPSEKQEELRWNIACDMIINSNIINGVKIGNRNLTPLKGIVMLETAREDGYKGKPIAEPLYEWLKKEYPIKEKSVIIINGKAASTTDDHSFNGDLTELDKKLLEDVIRNAVMRGWGNTSGDLIEKIDEITKEKSLNWKQLLRKYTQRWAYGKSPNKFRTWNKRNRRQLPLPGHKRYHNKIIVAVDTSGSIDKEQFKSFFKEIETITRDISKFKVIQCDADIKAINHYKRGDYKKIDLKGRGGTDFQPVFDWIREHKEADSLLIYFTDLCAPHQIETYGIRTIWCTTNNEEMPKHLGPTIHIKEER